MQNINKYSLSCRENRTAKVEMMHNDGCRILMLTNLETNESRQKDFKTHTTWATDVFLDIALGLSNNLDFAVLLEMLNADFNIYRHQWFKDEYDV